MYFISRVLSIIAIHIAVSVNRQSICLVLCSAFIVCLFWLSWTIFFKNSQKEKTPLLGCLRLCVLGQVFGSTSFRHDDVEYAGVGEFETSSRCKADCSDCEELLQDFQGDSQKLGNIMFQRIISSWVSNGFIFIYWQNSHTVALKWFTLFFANK